MTRRQALLLAPFGVTLAVGAGFLVALKRMSEGTFDPHSVPSMIIGKPVPSFDLPLAGGGTLTNADLATGHPVIVNFFASWCEPCVEEAPVLMEMRQQGVPIYGIAYKDKPDATVAFLRQRGDPYAHVALDVPGMAAINWGLYGVPETYLIDGKGIVRWRYVGPISEDVAGIQLPELMKHYA